MTLAPVSPAAYAQIVMDTYKLMRLFGVFQQTASFGEHGEEQEQATGQVSRPARGELPHLSDPFNRREKSP